MNTITRPTSPTVPDAAVEHPTSTSTAGSARPRSASVHETARENSPRTAPQRSSSADGSRRIRVVASALSSFMQVRAAASHATRSGGLSPDALAVRKLQIESACQSISMTAAQVKRLMTREDLSPQQMALAAAVSKAESRADFEALAGQLVNRPEAQTETVWLVDKFARGHRKLPPADAQGLAPTMDALLARLPLDQQMEVAHTPDHFQQLAHQVGQLPAHQQHDAAIRLGQAANHSRIFMSDPDWERSVGRARTALSNPSMSKRIQVAVTVDEFRELAKAIAELPPAQRNVSAAALASGLERNIENMGFLDGYHTLGVMAELAGQLSAHGAGASADISNFAASVLNASTRILHEANGPASPLLPEHRAAMAEAAEALQDKLVSPLVASGAGQTPAQFEKLLECTLGRPEQRVTDFTVGANHKEGRRGTPVSAAFGLRVLPTLVSQLPRTPEGDRQAVAMLTDMVGRTAQKESVGFKALCAERTTDTGPLQAVHDLIRDRGLQDPALATMLNERQEMSDVAHGIRGTPPEVAEKMKKYAAADGLQMQAMEHAPPDTLESETLRSFGMLVNVVKGNNPAAAQAAADGMVEGYAPFVADRSKLEALAKKLMASAI